MGVDTRLPSYQFSDLELVWEWTSVDTFVSKTTPGGGEWWGPLDAIVDSLVSETRRGWPRWVWDAAHPRKPPLSQLSRPLLLPATLGISLFVKIPQRNLLR